MAKPLILIAEDQESIPFDLAMHQVIRKPRSLEEESPDFIKSVEAAFAEAFSRISPALEDEPNRLLAKKEYRAAVIAAFSLLEHDLRQLLESSGLEPLVTRSSLIVLLDFARKQEVLSPNEFQQIRSHAAVRNRIAHMRVEVTAAQAKTIVREVTAAMTKIRAANVTRKVNATVGADLNA